MVRWLVWTCGGLVVVGVLIRLFAVSAASTTDQTSAKAAVRPAPSTPASTSYIDPAVQFEMGIQQRLMKGGVLVAPSADAPPEERKAYEYVLEAKKSETSDAKALHDAAQRLWEEKKALRETERKERKAKADERARTEREKWAQKKAARELELPPEVLERRRNTPKPGNPPLTEPAFVEDPANPLPKREPAQPPPGKK